MALRTSFDRFVGGSMLPEVEPEVFDGGQLLRDVAYGESDWRRFASGVAEVSEAVSNPRAAGAEAPSFLGGLRDFAVGGALGGLAVVGWVPMRGWRALRVALKLERASEAARRADYFEDLMASVRGSDFEDDVVRYVGVESQAADDAGRFAGREAADMADDAARAEAQLRAPQARGGGGFTWDPRTGRLEWSEGFAVGGHPEFNVRIPESDLTPAHILSYLRKQDESGRSVADLLGDTPNAYIGGWLDDGEVHLDVIRVMDSAEEARLFGGPLGEKAIYDFSRRRELPVTDAYRGLEVRLPRRVAPGKPGLIRGTAQDIPTAQKAELEGARAGEAILSPSLAPQSFAAVSEADARNIMEELISQGPRRLVSGEDLRTPKVMELLETLQRNLQRSGLRDIAKYEAIPMGPYTARAADLLGLQPTRLVSAKEGQVYRPMMRAVLEGRFDDVLDDWARQINTVFSLVDSDVFRPSFYPFMFQIFEEAGRRTGVNPAQFFTTLSAVLSAGEAPMGEAQKFLKLLPEILRATRVENGRLVFNESADIGSGLRNAVKAYTELVNEPNWLMNDVTGLKMKTYVYALMRANPRLARGLVVDRVDALARLPALSGDAFAWGSDYSQGGSAIETVLNQFADRVVADTLGVPPWAVQENMWALWRVIRDLESKGGKTSRTGGLKPEILNYFERFELPKAHMDVIASRQDDFVARIAAGEPGTEGWKLTPEGPRIRDDLPIEYLIPPDVRTPAAVENFKKMLDASLEVGESVNPGARRATTGPTREFRGELGETPVELALSLGAGGVVALMWLIAAAGEQVEDQPERLTDFIR